MPQLRKRVIIPTNETGHTIGEKHHRAKLTDKDVELMQMLYEEHGFGYRKLAHIFGVKRHYVRDIVTYRRRSCTVAGHRVKWVDANLDEALKAAGSSTGLTPFKR